MKWWFNSVATKQPTYEYQTTSYRNAMKANFCWNCYKFSLLFPYQNFSIQYSNAIEDALSSLMEEQSKTEANGGSPAGNGSATNSVGERALKIQERRNPACSPSPGSVLAVCWAWATAAKSSSESAAPWRSCLPRLITQSFCLPCSSLAY
jgi:hypothetical protein